jgi:trigger factor
LAGKEVKYTAKITGVRIKVLPELDDEWAKSMGEEYESVSALREKVRENLMERARAESQNRLAGDVIQKLVDAHPFEVPQSFIDQQTNQNLEMVVRDMLGRGVDPRTSDLNWEGVRDSLKEQSARDVRSSILLDRIAEAEKIEVTNEEVAAEIAEYAEATRQTPEQVRAALTKQGGERSIAGRLRNRKALELIVENARVTDEEWSEEALQQAHAEEAVESAQATAQAVEPDEENLKAQAQSSSPDEAEE